MRLFIAVNFPEEIKDRVETVQKNMGLYVEKANYSKRENLHLTLAFIGETGRTGEIKEAINRIKGKPFTLTLAQAGRFQRRGGDILWLGMKRDETLWAIQKQLSDELRRKGFPIEEREFRPHVTLAREAVYKDGPPDFQMFQAEEINMEVDRISLMNSQRISGKLVYTEIYSKTLS